MKVVFFIYQWFIMVPAGLVGTLITALTTIVGCRLGNGDVWGYYPARLWSRFMCVISLVRVEVRGLENIDKNRSYVFVANHQGAYDIFLVYGYLDHNFKWMMKKGLRKMPLVGKACESAGHIFVDDKGARGVRHTITQARETLCNGMSLVVFPEGSRSRDGKIHRFKKGAYQLACDMELPVVPMTIEGPFSIMRRGSLLLHPHKMTLTIHKPIEQPSQRDGAEEYMLKESFDAISSSFTGA